MWVFWSHRLDLARAARDAGWEVLVATRVQEHGPRIEAEGFQLFPLRIRRRNWHPLRELAAIVELVRLYRRERPDIVYHVTLKPVLYGSWAAHRCQDLIVINAFDGLGYVFTGTDWRARLLYSLIRPVLQRVLTLPCSRVLVQNPDDCDRLIRAGIVQPSQIAIIRGSGLEITKFTPCPEIEGPPVVVLAARMLWDKGVGEFVQAARLLKDWGVQAQCVLVGKPDTDSPTNVPEAQLRAWHQEGTVAWWGFREDMPSVFAAAHIVTLPSYYGEGLPKVLLEAAACARPLIATDIRGCREVVRHGENGLLIPARDAQALARAIATLVGDPGLRRQMGARSRDIAVREFSTEQIARQTFAVYDELLQERSRVVVTPSGV